MLLVLAGYLENPVPRQALGAQLYRGRNQARKKRGWARGFTPSESEQTDSSSPSSSPGPMHTQTREKGRDEEKEATCSAMTVCPGKGNVIHTGAQSTPGVRDGSLLERPLAWTRIHRLEPRVTEGEGGTGRDSPEQRPGRPASPAGSWEPWASPAVLPPARAAAVGPRAWGRRPGRRRERALLYTRGWGSPRGRGRPSRLRFIPHRHPPPRPFRTQSGLGPAKSSGS